MEHIISSRKVLSYETHEWMKLKDTCTLLTNNIIGLFLSWVSFGQINLESELTRFVLILIFYDNETSE